MQAIKQLHTVVNRTCTRVLQPWQKIAIAVVTVTSAAVSLPVGLLYASDKYDFSHHNHPAELKDNSEDHKEIFYQSLKRSSIDGLCTLGAVGCCVGLSLRLRSNKHLCAQFRDGIGVGLLLPVSAANMYITYNSTADARTSWKKYKGMRE
jgi:hypothetical protein